MGTLVGKMKNEQISELERWGEVFKADWAKHQQGDKTDLVDRTVARLRAMKENEFQAVMSIHFPETAGSES